jgi:hypothetical protein
VGFNHNQFHENMSDRTTKIDEAIYQTQLQLKNTQEQIMLLSKQREVLSNQLDTLDIIKNNKAYT